MLYLNRLIWAAFCLFIVSFKLTASDTDEFFDSSSITGHSPMVLEEGNSNNEDSRKDLKKTLCQVFYNPTETCIEVEDLKEKTQQYCEVSSPQEVKKLFKKLSRFTLRRACYDFDPQHLVILRGLSLQNNALFEEFSQRILASPSKRIFELHHHSDLSALLRDTPLSKQNLVEWMITLEEGQKDTILEVLFSFKAEGYEAFASSLSPEISGFIERQKAIRKVFPLLSSKSPELSSPARDAILAFLLKRETEPDPYWIHRFLKHLKTSQPENLCDVASQLFDSFVDRELYEGIPPIWKSLLKSEHNVLFRKQMRTFFGVEGNTYYVIPGSDAKDVFNLSIYYGFIHSDPLIRGRTGAFLKEVGTSPLSSYVDPLLMRLCCLDTIRHSETPEGEKCAFVKVLIDSKILDSDSKTSLTKLTHMMSQEPEALSLKYIRLSLVAMNSPESLQGYAALSTLKNLEKTAGIPMPKILARSMVNAFSEYYLDQGQRHIDCGSRHNRHNAVLSEDHSTVLKFFDPQGTSYLGRNLGAFNAESGDMIWSFAFDDPIPERTDARRFHEYLRNRYVGEKDGVVWGCSKRQLVALDHITGKHLGTVKLPKRLESMSFLIQPEGIMDVLLVQKDEGASSKSFSTFLHRYDSSGQMKSKRSIGSLRTKNWEGLCDYSSQWLVLYSRLTDDLIVTSLVDGTQAIHTIKTCLRGIYTPENKFQVRDHNLLFERQINKHNRDLVLLNLETFQEMWTHPLYQEELETLYWNPSLRSQIFFSTREELHVLDQNEKGVLPLQSFSLAIARDRWNSWNSREFLYDTGNEEIIYGIDIDKGDVSQFNLKTGDSQVVEKRKHARSNHLLGVNQQGHIISWSYSY